MSSTKLKVQELLTNIFVNFLNVHRIDHGVQCLKDDKLVGILSESQIPLTVCPLSNVKLKVLNGFI